METTQPANSVEGEQVAAEGDTQSIADVLYSDGQAKSVEQAPEAEKAEGEEEAKADEGYLGAPEQFEFVKQGEYDYDPEFIKSYSEVAKELNLSQKGAQKILDKILPTVLERQNAALAEMKNGWETSSRTDSEYGGKAFVENLGIAKKALDVFGGDGLRKLLNETGIGSHPEMIRFMYRAGRAIMEDNKLVTGEKRAVRQTRDFNEKASALYG